MRIFYTVLLIMLMAGNSRGQTDVNISHRYMGRMNYNPAATGSDPDAVNLRAFFREQWIGFDRAPSTQVVNVDNYFRKYRSGGGLVFIKDEIGYSKSLNFKLSYSYRLQLTPGSYISLGLALGLIHNNSDERNFRPEHTEDPALTYLVEKETMADFDIGAEYHWQNLSAGFSIAHLTKGKNDPKVTPHYYGYVNYAMNLDEDWRLTPNIFAAVNNRTRIYEVGVLTEYRNKINLGLMYRVSERFFSDAVIGLLGVAVSDYVSLAYSYDFTIGQSSSDITGAHELVMSFRIKKKRG